MKKVKIIIGIILVSLISVTTFLFVKEILKSKSMPSNFSGYVLGNGVAPDLTPEEIQELMQKQVDKSKIAFSIYTEPTFEGKRGTIMFANPRYSAHNIELEVKVNNKVVIKTQKIAPDQYIEDIEFIGKALKKGKHKGVATIKAYDRETDKLIGEVVADMIITSK